MSSNGSRYKINPFLDENGSLFIPTSKKQIRVEPLGKDENVLVNQSTGEVMGTHVTTYKKVDSQQFVKLFTANIALTFNLIAAGIKALSVVVWSVQHRALSKDQVDLDSFVLSDFLEANKDIDPPLKLSKATFGRGLADLEKAKIIAKTMKQGRYFINPNFIFNGDRIAFTTIIERSDDTNSLNGPFKNSVGK